MPANVFYAHPAQTPQCKDPFKRKDLLQTA